MFASAFDPSTPSRTTIAGAPAGHDARALADIALRTHGKPLVHVALDDVRAAVLTEILAFFAPHVEVLSFPAWDCLPYDRISPHTDILGQRIATLDRLRRPFAKPCILLTTINAIAQKTLPPEALREVTLHAAVGDELPVEKLRRFLAASGYMNASTVREPGEFAVRGGIVDLFPPGTDEPARLDFFGDEIESIRSFDTLTQTTTAKIDALRLQPVTEVMLDERSIAAFRTGYRDLFGAVTDNDPLYESVTAGRKFPGMEHWLGLFYPRLVTLFDYVPLAPVSFDIQAEEAIASRLQQVEDFYQARLSLYQASKRAKKNDSASAYKPVPVHSLYLDRAALDSALQGRAVAHLSPFSAVDALDAGGKRGRDFADVRTKPEADLYGAVQAYASEQQAQNKRVALACYSQGSAERIAGLLRAHGLGSLATVKSWDEARKLDAKSIALVILGLEHGFVSRDLALITEQDILGDRLTRPARKRRAA
ncbi:MAG: transcription-repair coupling factor, partial [Alphaproteobacteria bacterium]|nr:transcription-repair coupling factor [Alphaproteobacteria bacterium]